MPLASAESWLMRDKRRYRRARGKEQPIRGDDAAICASHPFKIFTSPCCITLREFGIPRFIAIIQRSRVYTSWKCKYQRRITYLIYGVQEPRFPSQTHYRSRSFSIFALARMIEGHSEIFLDFHRYSEVVEVQRDGQPRMHIFENLWSRFNKRFDLTTTPATGDAQRQCLNRWK